MLTCHKNGEKAFTDPGGHMVCIPGCGGSQPLLRGMVPEVVTLKHDQETGDFLCAVKQPVENIFMPYEILSLSIGHSHL